MKQSKWIWHRGDFEIYHAMKLTSRREKRGLIHTHQWRSDNPHASIILYKTATIDKPETINVKSSGECVVEVKNTTNNTRIKYHEGVEIPVEPGTNFIKVSVYKPDGLPSVYVIGDTFASDETWWCATFSDTDYHVGTDNRYTDICDDPEIFKFSYTRLTPVSRENINGGTLYDFGKETFGILNISTPQKRDGIVDVIYGESREEALDVEYAELTDTFDLSIDERSYKARACRYIFIPADGLDISLDYEYLPLEYRGKFESSDERLKKIYDVCAYTLHLNTRECFLDGIKRDRWCWGGDAYQSFFCDYYLFNDFDVIKRTIISLLGNEPFDHFTNMIPDYTFLIIVGIYNYYIHSGDKEFISFIYPKFEGIFRHVNTRLEERGLFKGGKGDWLFIDWADTAKEGIVTAEQMVLCAAYEAASKCADVLGEDGNDYFRKHKELKKKINDIFWREELGAYVDCIDQDDRKDVVTRHANIFALLFDICDERQKARITECVIKNDKIPAITTPYFEFFELDAMCQLGEYDYVIDMIHSYWGGMIDLGATTIWEEYDPKIENIVDHYSMYGAKYGMSLCHAWGASPIYFIGRYAAGVYPTSIGYETFNVEPNKFGIDDFTSTVPVSSGSVTVSLKNGEFTVVTDRSGGTLIYGVSSYTLIPNEKITIKA